MRLVPLADPDVTVLVTNANVEHARADGACRRRRAGVSCQRSRSVRHLPDLDAAERADLAALVVYEMLAEPQCDLTPEQAALRRRALVDPRPG